MHTILADYRERKLEALHKSGSLQCFHTFYSWFMSKKHLRAIDGEGRWPYEHGEPVRDIDWAVFLRQYEYLKEHPSEVLPWPVKYPDDTIEDYLTPDERFDELLRDYKKKMEEQETEEEGAEGKSEEE